LIELIDWIRQPGAWNDVIVLCAVIAVVLIGCLIKQDGKNFWKNF